jgi:hypothetical protein
VLSGRFTVLDLADRILHRRVGWAWSALEPVLAGGEIAVYHLPPVRVPVDVDVGHAHRD